MRQTPSSCGPPRPFDERLIALRRERAKRIRRNGRSQDFAFLSRRALQETAERIRDEGESFKRLLLHDPPPELAKEEIREILGEAETLESGEGDDLNLRAGEFDAIVSVFSLHRRNDAPGALAQYLRALRPGGLLLATMPAQGTLGELRECLLAAESNLRPGAYARIDAFVEIRQGGSLLQRVGFALPVCDVEALTLRYSSLEGLVRDLRATGASAVGATSASGAGAGGAGAGGAKIRAGGGGGEAIGAEGARGAGGVNRAPPLTRSIWEAVKREYQARHGQADGKLRVSVNLLHLRARAPQKG